MLEAKDITTGDYIYEKYSTWDYAYILKVNAGCAITVMDNGTNYFKGDRCGNLGNQKSFIRLATNEEKRWLDDCINAGRLVPLVRLLDHYEIY
jgi:hypothetical protein